MKIIVKLALIISILLGIKLIYYIYKPEPAFYQFRDEKIIGFSVNHAEPKYTVKRVFQITHLDGTPVKLHIVQFECCGVAGMVKNGDLYLGYVNEVTAKPIFATTTQKIPEIGIETVTHELMHLVTLHYKATTTKLSDRVFQETMAYDSQFLYSQLRSFDEDNYLRLIK